MIEPISIEDIPPIRDERKLSPLRAFADETVDAFVESGADAAIVLGAPDGFKIEQIVGQLRNSIWRLDLKREVKIMQRKAVVYIVKISTPPKSRRF